MKHPMRALICALLTTAFFTATNAQTVSAHPSVVAPGDPLFVRVNGVFPTPCSLDGSQFEIREDEQLLELVLQVPDQVCPQVTAELDYSFGSFIVDASQFAADQSVVIRFYRTQGGEEILVGETEVDAAQTPVESSYVQSGVYWDPEFSGSGIAIETQGDDIFLALYEYAEEGLDQWLATNGRRTGNSFTGELLTFADGPCVTCDSRIGGNPQAIEPGTPVAVHFDTETSGFLATGSNPGRALRLSRFALRSVESEGTIAGVTFTFPDLTGRWLFTDTVDGSIHVVADLAVAPSQISDSGLAFFASPDRTVTLACRTAEIGYACELAIRETVVSAFSAGVGPNLIRGGDIVGLRLD